MPRAMKVRKENIENIIAEAKTFGLNLDFIRDNIEFYADYGWDYYLVTDGTPRRNNVTYTDWGSNGFFQTWKFATEEIPDTFVEIERI